MAWDRQAVPQIIWPPPGNEARLACRAVCLALVPVLASLAEASPQTVIPDEVVHDDGGAYDDDYDDYHEEEE